MNYFKTVTRSNGTTYTACRKDAPKWLKDTVHSIHEGMFPHDWIYRVAEDCMEGIIDGDEDPNTDSLVDIYTYKLLEWAINFSGDVNEVMEESHMSSLESAIQWAQGNRINGIWYALKAAYDDAMEDEADDAMEYEAMEDETEDAMEDEAEEEV
jgi:hypothetical protein